MQTIRVLKPLMFSHPAVGGEKLTTETQLSVGEHKVADAIADHPWIKGGADGRIETAKQAAERVAAAEQKIKEEKAEADNIRAQSEAAMVRLERAAPGAVGSAAEIEKELNTPVNVLRAKRAQGEK
jgi:hypothetical protein